MNLRRVGPVEQHNVVARLAFDRVVSVARVPLEDIVSGAQKHHVAALVAVDEVVAVPAQQQIGGIATQQDVVARPAIQRERDQQARQVPRTAYRVRTAQAVQRQRQRAAHGDRGGKTGHVHAPLRTVQRERHRVRPRRAVHVHNIAADPVHNELVQYLVTLHPQLGRQVDHHETAVGGNVERVGAGRSGEHDRVRRAVTGAAAQRPREVHVHFRHVGARQVVDRDRVRPAQRPQVELLDAGRVEDDVAHVARETQPRPVGRELMNLRRVGPVEQHNVVARLPFDRVASVARVPLEDVVSRAQKHYVAALVAVDEVVAVPT